MCSLEEEWVLWKRGWHVRIWKKKKGRYVTQEPWPVMQWNIFLYISHFSEIMRDWHVLVQYIQWEYSFKSLWKENGYMGRKQTLPVMDPILRKCSINYCPMSCVISCPLTGGGQELLYIWSLLEPITLELIDWSFCNQSFKEKELGLE